MPSRKIPPSARVREEALRQLQEHYGAGDLELDDLEARTEEIERAESDEELKAAMYGLPPLPVRGEVALEQAPRVRPVLAGPAARVVAVLGEAARLGSFEAPPFIEASTVLGRAVVDLSEARFRGVVDVRARAVLGTVKVIVPAGVKVECHGRAVLGAFPAFDQAGAGPRLVRIHGLAAFGSIVVEVRDRRGLLEQVKDNLRGLFRP